MSEFIYKYLYIYSKNDNSDVYYIILYIFGKYFFPLRYLNISIADIKWISKAYDEGFLKKEKKFNIGKKYINLNFCFPAIYFEKGSLKLLVDIRRIKDRQIVI